VTWIRSSQCKSSDCVEVSFMRSSRCNSNACVEVGRALGEVLVRDSKDPAGPRLALPPATFSDFLSGLKAGEFDRTG
jgi:hypothetical protein